MNVFLDTNVIVDVMQERQPFFADSLAVVEFCEQSSANGIVSALTFSTLAYVLGKALGADASYELIESFRKTVSVSPVTEQSVDWAIFSKARDFEDAMQYESALSARADVIVTRDPDGFANSKIRVVSPSEFLKEVRPGDPSVGCL